MKRFIAEIRKDSGLTQADCAARAGYCRQNRSRYERVERRKGLGIWRRAELLGIVTREARERGNGVQMHLADFVDAPEVRG